MSRQSGPSEEFIRQLTVHQSQLMGFAMASLGDYDKAGDVVQQTNVVLLQKHKDLRSPEEFMPWAITVCKYTIRSFVRTAGRERLVFSPELLDSMIDLASENLSGIEERQGALQECLRGLSRSKTTLLQEKYTRGAGLRELAEERQCSVDAIKGQLRRIRRFLTDCVERRVRFA